MKAILTAREVAEYLSLNEQTVNRFLREGRLKGFQIGRVWRVKKAELETFIEQEQTSEPALQEEPPSQSELIAPPEAEQLSREAIDKLIVRLSEQGLTAAGIAQELGNRNITLTKGAVRNRKSRFLKTPGGMAYLASLQNT